MSQQTPNRPDMVPDHTDSFSESVEAAEEAQSNLSAQRERIRASAGEHTVAVTGASGFVGRHLVRALLDAGHRVRGMTTDRAKAERVLPKSDRLTVVEGRVLDGRTTRALVEGADVVIHLIGIIREGAGGKTFQRMHVGATEEVLEASDRAGVGRYLHMSALGVRDNTGIGYLDTKFEAERRVMDSTLAWTIFRPGLIHGVDGEFAGMMKKWAEGRSFPFIFMPYFSRMEFDPRKPGLPSRVAPRVMPVFVDDVASAFISAIDRPEAVGEVYNLVGSEELSFPEMLTFVRDTLPHGKKNARPRGIPGGAAAAKARAAAVVGLGNLLPFDAGMAKMGERDVVASNEKAEAQLGFRPSGFREKFRSYAASMRSS